MFASDIMECVSCEQLIFPGEEIKETPNGVSCDACARTTSDLALLSY